MQGFNAALNAAAKNFPLSRGDPLLLLVTDYRNCYRLSCKSYTVSFSFINTIRLLLLVYVLFSMEQLPRWLCLVTLARSF